VGTYLDLIIAFFAVLGLFALMWLVFGLMLIPNKNEDIDVRMTVRADEKTVDLQRSIQSVLWYRDSFGKKMQVEIVLGNVNDDVRKQAIILSQTVDGVTLTEEVNTPV